MSIGTIVTIVLVVTTMVLGLVLIRSIFNTGTNAVQNIDTAIQNQINQLFSSSNSNLVVYPNSRSITIKRGSTPAGFGFAVKNPEQVSATFSYSVNATSMHNCGSLTLEQANSFLIGASGPISLGPSAIQDPYTLVEFDIPTSEPTCTVTYNLVVNEVTPTPTNSYSANVFVTIQ